MAKSVLKPADELTFEAAFVELEKIVSAMEAGEEKLEDSLEAFTRGQALIKRCIHLLDTAELKVRQVSGESTADTVGEA